jgi:hypothetical protein
MAIQSHNQSPNQMQNLLPKYNEIDNQTDGNIDMRANYIIIPPPEYDICTTSSNI